MKYIDCYTPLTTANCKALKAAGVAGVIRYLGGMSCGFSKGMVALEVAAIRESGLNLISVFERGANRMQEGYTAGVEDARDALKDAVALSQPISSAIYFACDSDPVEGQMGAVASYMEGVHDAFAHDLQKRNYIPGIYGGYSVLEQVACQFKWASFSWQYGKVYAGAQIRQVTENTTVAGIPVDVDEVTNYAGQWWEEKSMSEQTTQEKTLPRDVIGTQWADAVEFVLTKGVMFTYHDGLFQPEQPMNRGQVAASLKNLYEILSSKS